jgi:hypothetical protein
MEEPKTQLLRKSKYSFFQILSFAYTRTEAKQMLSRMGQRGRFLSQDSYLEIFKANIYSMDIRCSSQIYRLEKFNNHYTFQDDIRLEVYLDFKREPLEVI